MLAVLSLLACAEPPPAVTAPDAHSWNDEADLVVRGLDEVQSLWESGQRPAAKTLADRVYTERFEPRMERALRGIEGPQAAAQVEYAFGQLILVLDGKDRARVEERVDTLALRIRSIAEAADRAFPPPGQAAAPPAPPADVRPVVPDVPPAWEAAEPLGEPAAPPPEG
ncbi:MAG: hypothetical protein EXR71_15575 [Myxococcales bacterium]|nr:hypothetical protein [Myxococcales bacterium]